MSESRFHICRHCGNLIGMIHDVGAPMMCCGEKMARLKPEGGKDGGEKHQPVVTTEGKTVTVSVGSAIHPMTEEHGISWVYLQTDRGGQRKCLAAGGAPQVSFALKDETPVAAYSYCNLHGLWKTELN